MATPSSSALTARDDAAGSSPGPGRPRTVLVAGAGGYVGSRLVPVLTDAGYTVLAGLRSLEQAARFPWSETAECVELDVLDKDEVDRHVARADAVCYLVHGLGGDDFMEKDHEGAANVAEAAAAHEVERIVYLSGLVPDVPSEEMSAHITSRLDVEATLGWTGVPVASLRAAVLIGGASTSFEIVRQVAERMPVHTVPEWMNSDVQPIATVDVLAAIVGALEGPVRDRHYDLGGPDRLAYSALLETYCTVAGIRREQITVPAMPRDLVGTLAGTLTDVPTATVESLVESLSHDMVCEDEDFGTDLVPGREIMGVQEALRAALGAPGDDVATGDPMVVHPTDPAWARREGAGDAHPDSPGALERMGQAVKDLNPLS